MMYSECRKWIVRVGLVFIAGHFAGCTEPAAVKSAWFGINTQLGHSDYDGRWPSAKTSEADREIYFNFVSELNVPMVRDLFMSWASVQPSSDAKYDFSLSDSLVQRAQATRAQILALCWGIPSWASPTPGGASIDFGVPDRQHMEAFKNFVRKFVERYDGDGFDDMPGLKYPIEAYEFLNEMENIPANEYAYWLKIFYQSVKSADAKATVVLGSLKSPGIKLVSQPDGEYHTYFDRLLAEPELAGSQFPYFNVVAFHNYPASYPGRSEFDDALAYLRKTMAAHQLALPIWLTEYGFNSGAQEEDRQKDNLIKWAVRARGLGIDRVYLFCLWDYHWPGGSGAGENMGLVREVESGQQPSKKPSFSAVQTLLRELQARPRVARRSEGVYVLTGSGEPLYIIWKEESYDPSAVLIPGWWQVRTLNGKSNTRQGSTIDLSSAPVFLQKVPSPFIK